MPHPKGVVWPKFWAHVQRLEGECWPWNGGTNGRYGVYGNQRDYAHRISYRAAHGEIPNGYHIDHLCRNPLCVNPDHLEAVTPRENIRRGLHGVLKDTCANGHPWTPENQYARPGGKRHCRICNVEGARAYRRRKREAIK